MQLKAVTYSPVGHNGRIMRDGFVFKNPNKKAAAILGIIKIIEVVRLAPNPMLNPVLLQL
jgi:hypothetical protein